MIFMDSAFDMSLWLLEFILNVACMVLAYRRKIYSLSAYSVMRAAFDITTFAVYKISGEASYDWLYMRLNSAEYLFQIILAVDVIGRIIDEARVTVRTYAAVIAIIGATVIMLAHGITPQRYKMFLGIEASVNGILCLMLLLACVMGRLQSPWKAVAIGLIGMTFVESVLGMIGLPFQQAHWAAVSRTYVLTDIVALLIWNYAARGRFKLLSARVPLEARGEAVELSKAAY